MSRIASLGSLKINTLIKLRHSEGDNFNTYSKSTLSVSAVIGVKTVSRFFTPSRQAESLESAFTKPEIVQRTTCIDLTIENIELSDTR